MNRKFSPEEICGIIEATNWCPGGQIDITSDAETGPPNVEPGKPWIWTSKDPDGIWDRLVVLSNEKGESLWELMFYKEDGVLKRMEINYVPGREDHA